METRELICIGCPLGCPLTVRIDGENVEVSGNTCKRGDDYARKEVLSPTRIVTSSVHVKNGELEMVSVKTTVNAPVAIGDVVIENCAGTGIPVIATKNVAAV